jgi:predicted dehydrogenase
LSAIEESSDIYALRAVYSRSQASAESLAEKAKDQVDVYYDSPSEPGKALDDLLKRADITVVAVCLPILAQPAIIRKALQAGKHVFSEKPIAGDAATAKELMEWYHSLGDSKPLWAVAENFRSIGPLETIMKKISEVGGKLVSFHMHSNTLISADNPYWNVDCEYHSSGHDQCR